MQKRVKHLVVDTNAFINNAAINDIGENVYTIQEVIDEVTSKRQLRHLSVLPYDLIIKDVFVENIKFVTEFSKKTGDYLSLSATDIKVIALSYQLEKEKVGTAHLNENPKIQSIITNRNTYAYWQKPVNEKSDVYDDIQWADDEDVEVEALYSTLEGLKIDDTELDNILAPAETSHNEESNKEAESSSDEDNDDSGWISVSNISKIKKKIDPDVSDITLPPVACITADFAIQNVLKQIGLKVAAYNGRLIYRVRTFIFRCTVCFKTTSVMSKVFCPNCGHASLRYVVVTVDENGINYIHINSRKPLTARGKRFSLPTPKGGVHANNPILTEDQPGVNQRSTKLARKKNNPLDGNYFAGFSPFVMRDVNSKSAVLGIRNGAKIKNWMRKNPNEARRKKK